MKHTMLKMQIDVDQLIFPSLVHLAIIQSIHNVNFKFRKSTNEL
jgi:hypothetical protein